MPFTQPTLVQAQTDLASRLNDPFQVHWVADELTVYLREALRTWNAWTARARAQGAFLASLGQTFYDLPTVLPALRGYTITTWELITDLQYALMEPPAPGGTWTGTDQFTLDQLSIAVQRRRDQFLRETGQVLTQSITNYPAPLSNGRLDLAENIAIIRRATWTPTATMTTAVLTRTTEWASTNFEPFWIVSTQPPSAFSVTTVPPLTLQLMPPASGVGDLDLISINTGPSINPTIPILLGVPDDFAWVVKFGALADLLNGDGLALDSQRAQYCESRWQEGLDIARRTPVTLTARVNNSPMRIGAVADADSYSPTWHLLNGVPRILLLTGGNLVASWPPPGAAGGPWTVTLDVVRNAPVPSAPGDVLQVGQEMYDSILDVAQHLALFKEGPGQLEQATALLQRASRAAGITLRLRQAEDYDRGAIRGQQQQDRRSLPEQLEDVIAIPVED